MGMANIRIVQGQIQESMNDRKFEFDIGSARDLYIKS